MNRNLSNCEKARKKGFRGFNGIRGLCVSAAVLYQPELWRPIHWRPANLLSSSTRERNETQNEMMWTAGIQMKWVCDHRSESQFKQLRKSPKKRISGLQQFRRSPEILFFGLFRNCLNCDSLRWSHTHFICIPAVHIISFCEQKLIDAPYDGVKSAVVVRSTPFSCNLKVFLNKSFLRVVDFLSTWIGFYSQI